MKKEDALSEEFFKEFKTGEEHYSFLSQIQKRGIEQMLEGELDAHLGNEKHQATSGENACGGHSKKKLKNQFGEAQIQFPRDRNSSLEPVLLPKRKNMAQGVENFIISLYAKGMSVSDMEEQIRKLYNIELSTSAISPVTERVVQDANLWQHRPLESVYCIVWMA